MSDLSRKIFGSTWGHHGAEEIPNARTRKVKMRDGMVTSDGGINLTPGRVLAPLRVWQKDIPTMTTHSVVDTANGCSAAFASV
jgi:hypothetical protein